MALIISLLLLGHVLLEFYIGDEIEEDGKQESGLSINVRSFQYFFIAGLIMLIFYNYKGGIFTAMLGLCYNGITRLMIHLKISYRKSIGGLIIDQTLKILCILSVAPFHEYFAITFNSIYTKFSLALIGYFPILSRFDNETWAKIILLITLYLFIINGGTVITNILLKEVSFTEKLKAYIKQRSREELVEESPEFEEEITVGQIAVARECEEIKKQYIPIIAIKSIYQKITLDKQFTGGEIIGNLERVIILSLIIKDQYTAISFVLAAKSIARYKKIEEEKDFSDKFLIGTLSSVMMAVLAGMLYKSIL